MPVAIVCPGCGSTAQKASSAVNRARKSGLQIYCSRACFVEGRRLHRTEDEKKRLKAEYDEQYRADRLEELKQQKREYFRRTYDPEKARKERATKMQRHVEYCRRYYADPARKKEKYEYDMQRRGEAYADFAEAWRLLMELQKEIRRQVPSLYERRKLTGYYDKINERKRHDRQERRQAQRR